MIKKRLTFEVSAMMLALVLFVGCRQKDKLANSTATFQITPQAAAVLKGQNVTLQARFVSGNNITSANTEWEISPSTSATLSTNIGPVVTVRGDDYGPVDVTASYNGQSATSRVLVVSYLPPTNTSFPPSNIFDVYSDNGLPSGSTITSDIVSNMGAKLTETSSEFTPEGKKFLKMTNVSNNDFMGVTLDKNSTGQYRDLLDFASGQLRFSIRVRRVVGAGEEIRIKLEDSTGGNSTITLTSTHGFDRNYLGWQDVSMPISSFTISKAFVKVPFLVTLTALTSTLSFDIDAVRWTK